MNGRTLGFTSLGIDRAVKHNKARNAAIAFVLVATVGIAGFALGSDFRGCLQDAPGGSSAGLLPSFVLSALRSF